MNTAKQSVQHVHKILLAGAGACDTTREKAADTFDQLFVSGSQWVNELLDKGEAVEAKLFKTLETETMLKETFANLKAKFGLGHANNDQKLAQLNQRVDSLIDVVAKLAQQRAAEQQAPLKTTAKAKPAKAKVTKVTTKTEVKPASKAKTKKSPAKPASKAKTATKAAVKASDKTTDKPAAKKTTKLADSPTTAKTDNKSLKES